MLNKKAIAAMLLSGGLILSGCGLSNTAKGAGIGAGAGAIIGAGVGRVAGNTALGAIIGGVVGGTAGTLIGKKMDKQKKQVKNAKIESVNEGQAIRVTFDSGILFATNSSTLSSTSQNSLRSFAANLKANSQTDMLIIGHTDNTGSDRINDPLSLNRASSVRSFLSAQGVDSSRMRVDGKGSHEPVADNSTASGRKENRRVEVYIIPNKAMVEAAQNGTLK